MRVDTVRFDDGEEAEREASSTPARWRSLPTTASGFYLVRQPREPVGEQALLELPAGKFDEEGRTCEATAKRELAEEIGKGARTWEPLTTFFTTPALPTRTMHLYLATDLYDEDAETDENERIEIVEVPLDELDDAIRECEDGKTLVGLSGSAPTCR